MKLLATLIGLTALVGCAAGRVSPEMEMDPALPQGAQLTVTNDHPHPVVVSLRAPGTDRRLARLEFGVSQTFHLKRYLNGTPIRLEVRCRTQGVIHATQQVVADANLQIDLELRGRLDLSTLRVR